MLAFFAKPLPQFQNSRKPARADKWIGVCADHALDGPCENLFQRVQKACVVKFRVFGEKGTIVGKQFTRWRIEGQKADWWRNNASTRKL